MAKPKLMVVDDETDNRELLYRTFRREFQVFRTDKATTAMEILNTEGEMGVIISDQSMPDMKGVEFLSKAQDRFPDTVMILLIGYSENIPDSEGVSIFKIVTKPWEPEGLKPILQEAIERYKSAKSLG